MEPSCGNDSATLLSLRLDLFTDSFKKMRYYSENSLEKVRNKGPRQPLSTWVITVSIDCKDFNVEATIQNNLERLKFVKKQSWKIEICQKTILGDCCDKSTFRSAVSHRLPGQWYRLRSLRQTLHPCPRREWRIPYRSTEPGPCPRRDAWLRRSWCRCT